MPGIQGKHAPTPAAARGGKEAGIPLDDILYVKGLVGRFGPDQLHTYRAPGSYGVSVWVADGLGRTSFEQTTVTVP